MQQFLKFIAVLIVCAVSAGALSLWYETVLLGNYFASAGAFLSIMAAAAPFLVVFLGFYAVRFIVKFQPSDLDNL